MGPRLAQSRSLGFLVWCGRTRHELSLARATRSKARLVSKSNMSPSSSQAMRQFYGTLILGLLLYNVEDDIKKRYHGF